MNPDPDEPVTVDRLADLQAGLLDDRTAARLRQRARTEPEIADQLAALDRVRRDVAALGRDPASAPPVPSGVRARIGAALRAAPPIDAPAQSRRWRRVAAVAGLGAIVAAAARGLSRRVGIPGVDVSAMGVTPGCKSADTGVITSTVVDRP